MDRILVVPGLHGSGPAHWQSWIEPLLGAGRVEQADWSVPDIDRWATRVEQAVLRQQAPVFLVAHSFGCLASAVAAHRMPGRIAGALFVAPANPEKFGIAARIPDVRFDFPSVLAASRNDPWMSYASAQSWAGRWGAELVDLGNAGHVNTDSGHGPWPEGLVLVERLRQQARLAAEPRLAQAI
ncbi:MAG TPA: alpha/beta hydrolase [Methyloversatilis sp.]